MPIPRDDLGENEDVLVDLRLHWVFFIGPAVLAAFALAAALAVVAEVPHAPAIVAPVLAVMVVVPAVWLAARLLAWYGISVILTSSRLLVRRGVFGRELTQIRLQGIAQIHATQSLIERMIGSGRLIVEVAGDDEPVIIDDVRHPRALQRVISARLDRGVTPVPSTSQGPAGSPVPPRSMPMIAKDDATPPQGIRAVAGPISSVGPSAEPLPNATPAGWSTITEQLVQLDELRRRGILTDTEFEAKKAQLLSRL